MSAQGTGVVDALQIREIHALQRAVGNRATIQALTSADIFGIGHGQTLRRVFTKTDPSTFDSDGGHGYADHGPQTTEDQHRARLTTGATPSRPTQTEIPIGGSSKFASLDIMKSAIEKAVTDSGKTTVYEKTGKRGGKKARITLAYNIKGAGTNYKLGVATPPTTGGTATPAPLTTESADWVVIVLKLSSTGYDEIVTMFPSGTAPSQKDN